MFSSFPRDIYIGMVVLAALGLMVPKAVLSITDVVGAANPFLAMLMIGVGLNCTSTEIRFCGSRASCFAATAWRQCLHGFFGTLHPLKRK